MSDLRELYRSLILEHNKRPRNRGPLAGADFTAEGFNPLCGDKVLVHVKFDLDGRLTHVHFEGHGCAIATASASMMTESTAGEARATVEALRHDFLSLMQDANPRQELRDVLGELAVFEGVREFPARIKCATLAWHTIQAALDGVEGRITTE